MSFFHFSQNNSGGRFVFDGEQGITRHVVIEALNAQEANSKAESIGLYFDGDGDCPCCGDRWYEAYGEGDAEPMVYGEPVTSFNPSYGKWMKDFEVFVHYKDGTLKGYCP